MMKLPRWVKNSLQSKNVSAHMYSLYIRVNSHEYKDGYETVNIEVGSSELEYTLMRVAGRSYSDRALMCCFECSRTTKQLAQVDLHKQHLRACGCSTCRVLLCVHCWDMHIAMHELAGDRVFSWWTATEALERIAQERMK